MISIIIAFYQAENYLKSAILSVLNQSYDNWELLLIDDGSTDQSRAIALSFDDPRIRFFEQKNKGVSAARNLGLSAMKGDYFCFLDADDTLTIDSLELRINKFKTNHNLSFVDGGVKKFSSKMDILLETWSPKFEGDPLIDLIKLTGNSFFGPTWLIKRQENIDYQFEEEISHGEDLLFFLKLARKGGLYSYTKGFILNYRDTPNSAMKNLNGLENGYRYIKQEIINWSEITNSELAIYNYKYKKAMFLSYLFNFQPIQAIKSIFH